MDGLKMIYSRRSIRRFSSKLIDEDIISLIAAGYPLNNDVFKEKPIKNSDFTII